MNANRFDGRVNLTESEISGKIDFTGSIFGVIPELSGAKGEVIGVKYQ